MSNDINASAAARVTTRCCIAGGGPAGMMLALLLARAGIAVSVLEKHADFLRDFRGDTIHPSTLEIMHELGLLDELLREPHQELQEIGATFGDASFALADLTHLPTHCKFVAMMPQWNFLNFIVRHARRYPAFDLRMEAEVTDLIEDGETVVGVRATTPQGALEVRADLVIGADGRHSTVRAGSGLEVIDLGAPIDVLWFRLSKRAGDPAPSLGNVRNGKFMVMIDRGDYWQCGYVIPKGAFDDRRRTGIEKFRTDVADVAPFVGDRTEDLKTWDDVKLLSVAVDRLRRWYRPGLLCIGDSAHAMSPVGGVGINLAIQDAVAAANILAPAFGRGAPDIDALSAVQRRRELPARLTQRAQIFLHEHLLAPIFRNPGRAVPPWPLRLMRHFARLRRIPARMIGLGVRPEHVTTRDIMRDDRKG